MRAVGLCTTATGSLKGGVVVTHDVTDLKRVEDELRVTIGELRKQTKIMETIVGTMADGVIATDLCGNNILYNKKTDEIVGGREPILSDMEEWPDMYQVYHLDNKTKYAVDDLPMVRALRGESTYRALMRVSTGDKRFVLEVSGRPLLDDAEDLMGGVVVIHDITQLRATEEKLEATVRELEQQSRIMQTAFDSISDGVAVVNAAGDFLLTNPSLQQMSGVKLENTLPEDWQAKYGLFNLDEETPVPTHENLLYPRPPGGGDRRDGALSAK